MSSSRGLEIDSRSGYLTIVPDGIGENHGGVIYEGENCAVRTDCTGDPEACAARNGPDGSVCWDPVKVKRIDGSSTIYNDRALLCGKTKRGLRELTTLMREPLIQADTPNRSRRRNGW